MHRVEEWLAVSEKDAAAETERLGMNDFDPMSPIGRWVSAKTTEALRKDFEEGDRMALIGAAQACAVSQLIMPDWIVAPLSTAYLDVWNRRVASWDEVFGAPLKKRQRRAVAEKNHQLAGAVYYLVTTILREEPDTPKDEALFERVGERLGIGKTLASELWYKDPVGFRRNPF